MFVKTRWSFLLLLLLLPLFSRAAEAAVVVRDDNNKNGNRALQEQPQEQELEQEGLLEQPGEQQQEEEARLNECLSCDAKHPYDSARHKEVYTVGVLAFRGAGTAYALHNVTFSDYLTATAGRRFDPPIRFEMRPVDFETMFVDAAEGNVDFIYVSPSPFACVEAEYGAQSLVSHISRRVIGENVYELPQFGGVIAVRADNDEINTVADIKGKIVASAAISSFGGGQMQFREVINAGLSFLNDPKQIVFTGNQRKIVLGVLSGEFDVGFIRTDQIERTVDDNGTLVDPNLLKVLDPKDNMLDGEPFPFTASTQLYPEWPFASLSSVPADVSLEVQAAMLALKAHADAFDDLNGTMTTTTRCDTTREIAEIAQQAMTNGKYAGFRTTQSYIQIRAMLQDTEFIAKDPDTNVWRCARPSELYNAITCPAGHFKKSQQEVDRGCIDAGLPCDEDYQCLCNPCVRAFDVEVFPLNNTSMLISEEEEDDALLLDELGGDFNNASTVTSSSSSSGRGCAKFDVCGTMEQRMPLTFGVLDNKKRKGAEVFVTLLEGIDTRKVKVEQPDTSSPYSYEFTISARQVGILILQVFVDGEQIPESPFRVQVTERACESGDREANADGECICKANRVQIGGRCVAYRVLLPSIFAPLAVIVAIAVYWYVEKKKREADSVWSVDPKDLHFAVPPVVIGQGTFGLVLLAEYRGTKVAVKRVLPPSKKNRTNDGGTMMTTMLATSDVESNSSSPTMPKKSNHSGASSGIYAPTKLSGTSSHGAGAISRVATKAAARGGFKKQKEEFMEEMRMLSKLRHPCITTVMGAVIKSGDPMLVMEFMDHGSLYDLLHNETMVLEGDFCIHVLRDIAQGVRFLHSAKPRAVIHGDLKSANVLVDSKFHAKVADFGLSQKKQVGAMGTPFWMAPELLRGESLNTTESDMYAIGIIIYEMYSRKEPYEGEQFDEVIHLVSDKYVNKRPGVPSSCPPDAVSLMKSLLAGDPKQRPNAKELDHRLKKLDASTCQPGQMNLSHRTKQEQCSRSKDVLYQVFPPHIADVLASGGKAEPESHEIVTIFFSDIVGFTNISSSLPPLKVSMMLDRLYLAFDTLAKRHGVFKVETIGDAYMCLSNLESDQNEDHVKRIAEFAIDAVETASHIQIDEENPKLGTVEIRVGFHSGPVVSNVVGSLNPRFGIFGDTVNVSSRMESTSENGRIHCSERSAKLLMVQAPHLSVKLRGETQIKGKGQMKTYWVSSVTKGSGGGGTGSDDDSSFTNEDDEFSFYSGGGGGGDVQRTSGIARAHFQEFMKPSAEEGEVSEIDC